MLMREWLSRQSLPSSWLSWLVTFIICFHNLIGHSITLAIGLLIGQNLRNKQHHKNFDVLKIYSMYTKKYENVYISVCIQFL